MAYLGKQPVLVSTEFRDEFNITSTANTVVTSGFVNSGSSNYLEVYRNGVLLGSSDYTLSTDNKTINLVDSAASGDIIVVTGRREINQGLKVTERRHEHVIQSGETTVTFPFPLTVDGTDVHINGVKLWYGNGSGDGTNSDFAINVNTKVVSFGVNPSVGDVVCIVSREPTATTSTPLPITDSNGASVLSEINGKVILNNANLGSSVVPNSSYMFRNKIINGGMQIDQRNAGASVGPFASASAGYKGVDRWFIASDPMTSQQITGNTPTGFSHYLKLTKGSGSNIDIRQTVELPAAGQAGQFGVGSVWTLSFYAKSVAGSETLNFNTYFRSGVATGTFTAVSAPTPSSVTLTTNWTRYSVLFTIDVSPGSNDLCIAFGLNTTATELHLTGVQLEEGTAATPFEHRPIGMELSLCQRYCIVSDKYGKSAAFGGMAGNYGSWTPASQWNWGYCFFPTTMRHDTPAVDVSDEAGTKGKISIITSTGGARTNGITVYSLNVEREGFNFSDYWNGCYGVFIGGYKAEAEL